MNKHQRTLQLLEYLAIAAVMFGIYAMAKIIETLNANP